MAKISHLEHDGERVVGLIGHVHKGREVIPEVSAIARVEPELGGTMGKGGRGGDEIQLLATSVSGHTNNPKSFKMQRQP